MFTVSSWIDEELIAQVYPYINLGIGYKVVFAKRAAVPVRSFSAQCTLTYSGGLNIIENFIIRAAAFSFTVEEFIEFTSVDLDIAEYLIQRLTKVDLIYQNEDGALLLTDKGKDLYERLQKEEKSDKEVVGYQDYITGQIQLLPSADGFVPISEQDSQLLTMTTDALRSQEAISQEKLQETFLNMTDADPYFGYKVMSAEIKESTEEVGIPIGLLLIYDLATGSLSVKVFDLLRGRIDPSLEEYFDSNHVAQVTELAIPEDRVAPEDLYPEVTELAAEQFRNYLAKVEQAQLDDSDDELKDFPLELVVDHLIKPRFLELIEEAKQEILILSPWIKDFAMEALIDPLTNAAKRGVRVIIAWGIDTKITAQVREENRRWMERFKSAKLPCGLPGIFFVWTGNHHRKELIVDQEHYVIGSFNWLSYRGEEVGGLKIRGESALFIHLPHVAKEGKEYFKKLIDPALKRDWKYYLNNLDAQLERNTCISAWVHLGMYDRALRSLKTLRGPSGQEHQVLADQAWQLMEKTLEANRSVVDPKEFESVLKKIVQMRQTAAAVEETEN